MTNPHPLPPVKEIKKDSYLSKYSSIICLILNSILDTDGIFGRNTNLDSFSLLPSPVNKQVLASILQ